jgi:hypothetical protein
MIIPIVHWKIFKPFLNILSNGTFLNQKTLDLLKFQNELPTKMDNYIGTLL